jgi:hypothetical protein
MVGVLLYGFFAFPDAPYEACRGTSGYCGKWGLPHSPLEFQRFSLWQMTLLIVWPVGTISVLILRRLGSNRPGPDRKPR